MACSLLPTPPFSKHPFSDHTHLQPQPSFCFQIHCCKVSWLPKNPLLWQYLQHMVSLGAHFARISHINTHKQSHKMETKPARLSQANFVISYWHAYFIFRVQSLQVISLTDIACLIYIYFSKQFKIIAKLIKNKGPRNTKHDLMMRRKVSQKWSNKSFFLDNNLVSSGKYT